MNFLHVENVLEIRVSFCGVRFYSLRESRETLYEVTLQLTFTNLEQKPRKDIKKLVKLVFHSGL